MKTGIKTFLLFLMIGLMSSVNVSAQDDEDADSPVATGSKYGADSASCVMHFSLYREFYKQNNFKDAMPHWKWVVLSKLFKTSQTKSTCLP